MYTHGSEHRDRAPHASHRNHVQSSIAETRVRVVAKALITHPRNPNAHGKLTLIRDLDCETILIVVNLILIQYQAQLERFGTTNTSRWNRVQHEHSRIDRLSAVVLSDRGCGDCAPNDVGVVAPPTDRASRQHIQGDVSYGIFPPVVPPFRSFGSCVCVCGHSHVNRESRIEFDDCMWLGDHHTPWHGVALRTARDARRQTRASFHHPKRPSFVSRVHFTCVFKPLCREITHVSNHIFIRLNCSRISDTHRLQHCMRRIVTLYLYRLIASVVSPAACYMHAAYMHSADAILTFSTYTHTHDVNSNHITRIHHHAHMQIKFSGKETVDRTEFENDCDAVQTVSVSP